VFRRPSVRIDDLVLRGAVGCAGASVANVTLLDNGESVGDAISLGRDKWQRV
jgi:hypothetical protein